MVVLYQYCILTLLFNSTGTTAQVGYELLQGRGFAVNCTLQGSKLVA